MELWLMGLSHPGLQHTGTLSNFTLPVPDLLCEPLQAIRVMRDQPSGGHIFNMDGAGADGGATPRFAAYGASKRGLVQLGKSLQVPYYTTENLINRYTTPYTILENFTNPRFKRKRHVVTATGLQCAQRL